VIVVSNTTAISELAKVGGVSLLQGVFGRVLIPEEVYAELISGNHPAAAIVPTADWIEVRSVSQRMHVTALREAAGLDLGEAAAIVLGQELNADWLVLDDRTARRAASARGIPHVGTIGILLRAKEQGLLTSVKMMLDSLIAQGTRIGNSLYKEALRAAGE